jgi:hypothetical protein
MNKDQIAALAQAIAHHAVVSTWPYWVVLIGLALINVFFGGFVGAYAAKRGEVRAARADRDAILRELRETTRVTEEIRSSVSLDEWKERERRGVRRAKLEELLLFAHKTRDWLSEQLDLLDTFEVPETASPLPTLMTLGSLYFPELSERLRAFEAACDAHNQMLRSARLGILDVRERWREIAPALVEQNVVEAIRGWRNKLVDTGRNVKAPLEELGTAAANLMSQMIALPK